MEMNVHDEVVKPQEVRTELAAESVRSDIIAAAIAGGQERTKLEEEAGAEPVGELSDVVKADEQAKVEETIKLVDRMNTEMEKNEGLQAFLMGLNNLVLKAGKAIPRKILLQNGVSKKDLNRLTQVGFIRETYLRHGHNGALYTCISLPEGVTFYGRHAVAIVRESEMYEGVAENIREGIGGAAEIVGMDDLEGGADTGTGDFGVDAPVRVNREPVGD